MKSIKTSFILLSVLAILPAFHPHAFAQNIVSKSVLGNGGAVLSDSTYRIIGTVGQPLVGVAGDQANVNNVGFWYLPTEIMSTEVEEETTAAPREYSLHQNYPNPFNPTTTIQFALPHRSKVTVRLFDILGRQVATLVDGELGAGEHKILFEAKDLASGLYVYRIQSEGFVQSKKLMLLK